MCAGDTMGAVGAQLGRACPRCFFLLFSLKRLLSSSTLTPAPSAVIPLDSRPRDPLRGTPLARHVDRSNHGLGLTFSTRADPPAVTPGVCQMGCRSVHQREKEAEIRAALKCWGIYHEGVGQVTSFCPGLSQQHIISASWLAWRCLLPNKHSA